MEQQFRQRFVGATIIVSLIVIFVPMLFDEHPGSTGKTAMQGVPALPQPLDEHPIELPKSAADLAPPKSPTSAGSTPGVVPPPVETGYRIIPLEDPPARKPEKPKTAVAEESMAARAEAIEEVPPEEEGAPVLEDEEPSPVATPAKPVKSNALVPSKPAGKKPRVIANKPASTPHESITEPPMPATKPVIKPKPPTVIKKPAAAPALVDEETSAPPKPVSPPLAKSTTPKPAQVPRTVPPEVKPAAAPHPAPTTRPPPPEAATKPEEASPPIPTSASSWVIQTGSFTNEANARTLAEKLRKSKFPAYVEAVPGETGAVVYKVQVGPELDRTRAEQTQKQIEGISGLHGFLVPHR